eukprot:1343356-Rhodomonas_salina.3
MKRYRDTGIKGDMVGTYGSTADREGVGGARAVPPLSLELELRLSYLLCRLVVVPYAGISTRLLLDPRP